jgi:isopentenyl diphosphate isomerase/L-lactate dehydrogenase-like FMN-dependent dehydrogenase
VDDEAEFESVGHVDGFGHRSQGSAAKVIFGRAFVFDLELAGDASTVTVFEGGAPRLKRSMTYADVERLLDQLAALPVTFPPE